MRTADGFRDALREWRDRWEPAWLYVDLDGLFDDILGPDWNAPDNGVMPTAGGAEIAPRQNPRTLVPPRDWDAEEAIEHPWLHLADSLAWAEGFLDSDADFRETSESGNALDYRAAATAIAALGEHLGGWKAFGQRLAEFEPVAVPHDVAATHGATDHASLLRSIAECQRAFVFGTPLAAIMLARRTIEITLRDHWVPETGGRPRFDLTLEELMKVAAELYPEPPLKTWSWEFLRRFANAVTHGAARRMVALERDMPGLIDEMRQLVELAPRA